MAKPLPILTETEEQTAQGIERGFGTLSNARGNLPLRRLAVQARLEGLVATTTVRQTFVNLLSGPDETGEALEATYIFPLPDRAAVTRFELRVGQRLIEGILRERGEARQEYDAAIQAGHRAAIAEEDRSGVFTIRVGNIPPGEAAEVTLELTAPVSWEDGEGTFQFPLVVAPRYIPGAPLPGASVGQGTAVDTTTVPDASRINPPVLLPGFPNPVDLEFNVEIRDAGLPLRDFRSSLHAVVEELDGGVRRISLRPGERLNRDFILRFQTGESAIHSTLQVFPDPASAGESGEGTWQLCILPPTGESQNQRPRDVVFLLDRSGSMQGWKMVTARRALARMIDTLGEADRFSVIAFDNSLELPASFSSKNLVHASDRQRFAAVEFLARLEARGGTEIANALEEGIATLERNPDQEHDRILVLLTDGQVGNEDELLKRFGPRLKGLRVFALGIDMTVNSGLLTRLALLGGGYTEIVESEDRLDEVLTRIHRRIATPVVQEVQLQVDGTIEPETQNPRRNPDLFAGTPLIIRGRYSRTPPTIATIRGVDAIGRAWSSEVQAVAGSSAAASRLWAREEVRELEDQYVIAGNAEKGLASKIVDVSVRFQVLSRFTAYVAVDRSEIVNAGGGCRQIVQPVEAPEGWGSLAAPSRIQAARQSRGRSHRVLSDSHPPLTVGGGGSAAQSGDEEERVHSFLMEYTQDSIIISEARDPVSFSKNLGSLRRGGGQRGGDASDSGHTAPADFNAYRLRCAQILAEVRRIAAKSGAAVALARLMPKLTDLMVDIVSVNASSEDLPALAAFCRDLFDALTKGNEQAEADTLWTRAQEVLSAFSEGKPVSEPQRKEFWK